MESTHLYYNLFNISDDSIIQFFHHPWNGLRFGDLIQPEFMF